MPISAVHPLHVSGKDANAQKVRLSSVFAYGLFAGAAVAGVLGVPTGYVSL
jgi:hypothetical protein